MYNKTNWEDGVTTLSAQRLNNIEDGIVNNEAKTVIPNPTIKTGDDTVKNLLKWNKDQSYYEKDEGGMPYDGSDIVQLGKFYSVGAFDSGDVGYRLYRQSDGTISTDVRESKYYIGWIYDENSAYIGVEGGENKNYTSDPDSDIVFETTLDADYNVVTVSGLDINADGGIHDLIISTKDTSANIYLRINGSSAASYCSSYIYIQGGRTSTGESILTGYYYDNVSGAYLAPNSTDFDDAVYNARINHIVNGYPKISGIASSINSGNQKMYQSAINLNEVVANITSLEIRVSSGYTMGAGTNIKILRRR